MSDSTTRKKPVVLVYAEPLLASSMTFIRTQAEALSCFSPHYISPHYLRDGLALPEERVVVMRRGQGTISQLSEVPFKVLGLAPLFLRRLKKLRPVLLHAHFGFVGLRALPIARALGIPLLVTFHGCDATLSDEFFRTNRFYSGRVYLRRRGVLNERAILLIAVSNFIREEMIRQGFSASKIAVHYIGVDTNLFCPDASVKREPIVLFTGRLDEVKGCSYLIRAMARLQSILPQVELVLIGDGSLRSELEQLAAEKLRKYRFLGFQPPEVVKHWMNRAAVFAMPSVRTPCGSEEGLPTVSLEAQAMRLPVVSFASGGIPEAVAHGVTGFLAPERDTEALTSNLRRLLVDPSLSARMGEEARERACTQFNVRTQTRKLEELYKQALGKDSNPFAWSGQTETEIGGTVAALDAQG
jgi:colanic acid/amylovoran biosynthesis glycosyltransferase